MNPAAGGDLETAASGLKHGFDVEDRSFTLWLYTTWNDSACAGIITHPSS